MQRLGGPWLYFVIDLVGLAAKSVRRQIVCDCVTDGVNRVGVACVGIAALGTFAVATVGTGGAQAGLPKFPNIGTYAPADAGEYAVDAMTPGRPSTQVYFRTPDGVSCNFLSGQAQCIGNDLPGIPPASPTSNGGPRVNWIGTASGLKFVVPSDDRSAAIKTLPAMHSIAVDGVICGVDGSGTTACKDPQGRGFILSTTWSGWLPKV